MSVKLLATKKNGEQVIVELDAPISLSASAEDTKFSLFYIRDGNGTDHYFNKEDGTYDGWGKAICEDAEPLLSNESARSAVP